MTRSSTIASPITTGSSSSIEALVAIESPSDDPAAVNRCGAELASRLEAIGGTDHARVVARPPAITFARAFGAAQRQILLLGHFDTVWPIGQLERMPLKRDGGRLYGPGVFDMKAGIGLATLATRALARARRSRRSARS